MTPLVVKLGGSTAGRDDMQGWIDALATASFPLVIVPGGGPFADHIRVQQKRLHFSDGAAHDMAILAMDQFGIMIAERHPRLQTACWLEDFAHAWSAGRLPVWLPSAMTRAAPDIPRSWDVTSDSLAAWLARKIGAAHLLLIKQVDADSGQSLDILVRAGIVDSALPQMLRKGVELRIAGPKILRALQCAPVVTDVPGQRIPCEVPRGVLV